jgi:hypothetical protein
MLKCSKKICVQPTGYRVQLVANLGVKHLAVRNVLMNTRVLYLTRKIGWMEYVAGMEGKGNSYTVLTGKPE